MFYPCGVIWYLYDLFITKRDSYPACKWEKQSVQNVHFSNSYLFSNIYLYSLNKLTFKVPTNMHISIICAVKVISQLESIIFQFSSESSIQKVLQGETTTYFYDWNTYYLLHKL